MRRIARRPRPSTGRIALFLLVLSIVALVAPASQARSVGGAESTAEPRQAPNCRPDDRDCDGVPDTSDECPDVAVVDPADRDCDGTPNASDTCPDASGKVYKGCPTVPFVRAREANFFTVRNDTLKVGRFYNDLSVRVQGARAVDLTFTVGVNAATRAKYRLASAVIIKATLKKSISITGYTRLRLATSRAVRNKLKSARSLPVTMTMTVRSPVVETVTEKLTLYNQATPPRTGGGYFDLTTSGDAGSQPSTEQGDGDRGR